MTQRERIAALEKEIAELREEIEGLKAQGGVHLHHHYAPVPAPVSQPQPWLQPPFYPTVSPNTCGATTSGSIQVLN